MSNPQIRSLEAYLQLMNFNTASHVVRTGVNLGIIAELKSGQKSAKEISDARDLALDPTAMLLTALCQTGLVEKYGDLYALAPVAHLVPTLLQDFGDRYWEQLETWVRTGKNIPERVDLTLNESDYFAQSASNDWVSTPAAMDAAQVLDIGTSRRGLKILEVGGRSSVYSLTMAHIDPTARVTILDNAQGLQRAKRTAKSIEAMDRVEWVEADFLTDPLPVQEEAFDLVILANIARYQSDEQISKLLKRLAKTVRDSGELGLIDIFPGQEKGDQSREFFELELALRLSERRLCSPLKLQTLFEESGFKTPRFAHFPSPPHFYGMLLAEKKGQAIPTLQLSPAKSN